MKRKTLGAVLGAALVLVVICVIVWQVRLRTQSVVQPRSAVVERGSLQVVVSASGNVAPLALATLAFESSSQVAEVYVAVGDQVSAGQALARLDTSQLELDVAQSEAGLQLAEAQLAQLQEGPQAAEVAADEADLRAAEARVSAAAASLDQVRTSVTEAQIANAETQLASAKEQERQAQLEYDTIIRFIGDETDEDSVYRREQSGYKLIEAQQKTQAAQATLDDLRAGADAESLRKAQAELAAAQAQRDASQAQLDLLNAGSSEEKIAAAQAQVDQARAALALAQLSLDRATLRAPFAGEVATLAVEAGEMATAYQPAITLLDTSRFELTVSVDEIDVGQLTPGQVAQVKLDAFADEVITGTIERIAPIADPEGGVIYYDVTLALVPGDVRVRADMTATADVTVEKLEDVLILPTSIVRVDNISGQSYVHRRNAASGYERVDVTLGVRYGGKVQVLDGLSEGDTVYWIEDASNPLAGMGS